MLGVLVLEDLSMALYLPLLTALLAAGGARRVIIAVVGRRSATVTAIIVLATRYGHTVTRCSPPPTRSRCCSACSG